MLLNISPLKNNRDFRWLFFGQLISMAGSMVSYVVVPYQVYQLTHSNAWVGTLGIVELVPMILFSLLGGTYADRLNRRKLMMVSEFFMAIIVLLLAVNSMQATPNIFVIFALVAILQAINGFHRPALEAITQQILKSEEYPAGSALGSFRYSITAIVGPSVGGILIAKFGMTTAYVVDAVSFFLAVLCIWKMTRVPDAKASKNSPLEDMKEGLRFALSKPVLVGTYIIDIVAMIFAWPVALYPAMSEKWGGAEITGWLFASMSVGALVATLFSGWSNEVRNRGRGVVLSATCWGIFMIGTGFTSSFPLAFFFLVLAGGADMFSALFRKVIWAETIPNSFRGRLSGIEMISYTTGPLLGNVRAGYLAAHTSVPFALYSGGILCVIGVVITALLLPHLWRYRSSVLSPAVDNTRSIR